MVQTQVFRVPSESELNVFARLLEVAFPGRDELKEQLANSVVRPIDEYGSLEIKTQSESSADVVKTVPVEAETKDSDGIAVHYLLHVRDGRAIELDVFKDDGSPLKRPPSPGDLRVVVLPA